MAGKGREGKGRVSVPYRSSVSVRRLAAVLVLEEGRTLAAHPVAPVPVSCFWVDLNDWVRDRVRVGLGWVGLSWVELGCKVWCGAVYLHVLYCMHVYIGFACMHVYVEFLLTCMCILDLQICMCKLGLHVCMCILGLHVCMCILDLHICMCILALHICMCILDLHVCMCIYWLCIYTCIY